MKRLTLGQLRELTKNLPNDFVIKISADTLEPCLFNFVDLIDISVDIGHSDKVVHFFGTMED